MPVLSIKESLGVFQAMQNDLQAAMKLDDVASRNTAFVNLAQKIVSASGDQLALLQRIDELEKQLRSFEDWQAQKQGYEPQRFDPGVTVYVLKQGMEGAELGHHFCPSCYENGKASILQGSDRTFARRSIRVCLQCKTELSYGERGPMPQVQRRTIHGGW